MSPSSPIRCPWCPVGDPLYEAYHDEEWGVPMKNGRHLFEMLNLEGEQAGLSWRTVLGKRDTYRVVFENFNPARIADWSDEKIATALLNPGIIRNRLKVRGVVRNARALQLHFVGDLEKFSHYLWSFVEGKPIQNELTTMSDYPSRTIASDKMSLALKQFGFAFVGSTICYAFMQATGMVNDHAVTCFRREPVKRLAAKWRL